MEVVPGIHKVDGTPCPSRYKVLLAGDMQLEMAEGSADPFHSREQTSRHTVVPSSV